MNTFHHSELGRPESAWLLDERWDSAPVRRPADLLAGIDTVLALAAHPDDESLGAGGLLAAAAGAGVDVRVLIATLGEASHPDATAWTRDDLRRVRREESAAAFAALVDGGGELRQLAVPDGRVAEHEDAVVAAAAELISSRTLLLAPWVADGHPDHEAMGRAAERLAERDGVRLLAYPIWWWHWAEPADLPWDLLCQVPLGADAWRRKQAAIAAHATQVGTLGPAPGDAPILPAHTIARFSRVVEAYIGDPGDAPAPDSDRERKFDALLGGEGDPWAFDSFYERRKRDLTLATLQRPAYDRALDVGCATGALTAALAGRCGEVVGVDVSGAALDRAAARGLGNVTWVRGELPGCLREPPVAGADYDLIVLSEIGYFLTGDELLGTLRGVRALLADSGELALCHWRHPTEGLALDGAIVDRQARAMLDLPVRVEIADHDVLLTVFGGTPPTPGAER